MKIFNQNDKTERTVHFKSRAGLEFDIRVSAEDRIISFTSIDGKEFKVLKGDLITAFKSLEEHDKANRKSKGRQKGNKKVSRRNSS